MKPKLANVLLRIFMGIWILLSVIMLVVLLCNGRFHVNRDYVFQVLVAIIGSVGIGAYIWKNSKH